jgi:hypothetical protein
MGSDYPAGPDAVLNNAFYEDAFFKFDPESFRGENA